MTMAYRPFRLSKCLHIYMMESLSILLADRDDKCDNNRLGCGVNACGFCVFYETYSAHIDGLTIWFHLIMTLLLVILWLVCNIIIAVISANDTPNAS